MCARDKSRTPDYEPQLDTARDVAEVALLVADALVVVLRVVVQPHFRQPDAVPLQHVYAAAPLYGTKCISDWVLGWVVRGGCFTLYGERFRKM